MILFRCWASTTRSTRSCKSSRSPLCRFSFIVESMSDHPIFYLQLISCPRCKESVFVDRAEYEAAPILVCPLPKCNYAWCKACQQAIVIDGPKHSCDGSSELEHLMQRRGWKHCPGSIVLFVFPCVQALTSFSGCKTPFQKSSGCNHMTVSLFLACRA